MKKSGIVRRVFAVLLAAVLFWMGCMPVPWARTTVRAEETESSVKIWFAYRDGRIQEPDEKNAIILRPTDVGAFQTDAGQKDLTWECTDKYFRAEVGDLDYTTHYWIHTETGAFQPCEDVPTRGGVQGELKDREGQVLCSFIVRIVDDGAVITSVLRTLIKATENKVEADYTSESWKQMQDALEDGRKVCENAGSTQEAVDAADKKLREAVERLVLKTEETDRETETQRQTEAETESETQRQTEPETESETQRHTETETKTETQKQTEPETESETQRQRKSETESETQRQTEPETKQREKALPGKVTLKKITPGKRKAVLQWKKTSNASCYQVYRANRRNGRYKCVRVQKGTKYVNRKLKKGKTYYYKVRACRKNGAGKVYGAWSAVRKVKVK